MEAEMERTIANLQAQNRKQGQMIYAIEHTKVIDRIYLAHKIRIIDLVRAVKQHDIENDPEVVALRQA